MILSALPRRSRHLAGAPTSRGGCGARDAPAPLSPASPIFPGDPSIHRVFAIACDAHHTRFIRRRSMLTAIRLTRTQWAELAFRLYLIGGLPGGWQEVRCDACQNIVRDLREPRLDTARGRGAAAAGRYCAMAAEGSLCALDCLYQHPFRPPGNAEHAAP